jgi:hypothetical protein
MPTKRRVFGEETMMTVTPPHRRRKSLPRRNPLGEPAPTIVIPPTQKMMMTTTMGAMATTIATTRATTMMTMSSLTMHSISYSISIV